MMTTEVQAVALAGERPALRGMFHLVAALLAMAGMAWLLLLADSPAAYVGGAVFGTSLLLLYGTSASYHRITWTPPIRRIVKRLDHAMIFVLIGGTYTPFAFEVSREWWVPMLAVVWSLAGVGALLKALRPDAPRWLGISLYLGLGWLGVIAVFEVLAEFAVEPIMLLIAGGVLYTAGAAIYAIRRPNPWPRIFGYHEVFHALIVAGSAVHYAAIAIYILPG